MTVIPVASRNAVRNHIIGTYDYVAIGIGTAAEADANTALDSETAATGMARANITPTAPSDSVGQWVKEWTNGSGGTVSVTEYGIFDSPAAGVMFLRKLWGRAYDIDDGYAITVTATTTLTDDS